MMRALQVTTTVLAISSLSQCLDPTEIIVELDTNVACNVVATNGVAISIGDPGDEDSGINTVTGMCGPDGSIGTIVVTPSDLNKAVGIRVMLGVDVPAGQCTYPSYGDGGCIVARRALRFDPHTPLTLPIDLEQSCVGVICDPHSTCNAGGCVDASTSCSDGSCTVPDGGAPPDAGSSCDVGPLSIATFPPTNTARTPHIARTTSGYLVTFEPTAGALHGISIDANGTPTTAVVPLTQVPASNMFGPLGTDGTNYAISYFNGTSLAVDFRTPLGAIQAANPPVLPGSIVPLAGFFYDGTSNYFLATATTTNAPYTVVSLFNTSMLTGGWSTNVFAAPTEVTLVRQSASQLYVGFSDNGQCFVDSCSYTGGVIKCASVNGIVVGPTGCTILRMAATSSNLYTVAYDAGKAYAGLGSTSEGALPVVFDDPEAFMLLPTTTPRILWRGGGSLETMTFPSSTPTMLSATTTGFPAKAGPGFDAIEDGNGQPGYAAVYFQNDPTTPSIQYLHRCN